LLALLLLCARGRPKEKPDHAFVAIDAPCPSGLWGSHLSDISALTANKLRIESSAGWVRQVCVLSADDDPVSDDD
jgi:hypothetical protein